MRKSTLSNASHSLQEWMVNNLLENGKWKLENSVDRIVKVPLLRFDLIFIDDQGGEDTI